MTTYLGETTMTKYKVTSTERDGSYPFSTLYYTEEEARDLVARGNSSSLFRVYSYEEVTDE